jgi:type III pantothenate kinase
MLLAIDVGNTNIVVGVFRDETLVASWRLSTVADRTSDEYGVVMTGLLRRAQLNESNVHGVAISSVVPPLTATFRELAEGYYDVPALVVSADLKTGVRLLAENPHEVGADRIARPRRSMPCRRIAS